MNDLVEKLAAHPHTAELIQRIEAQGAADAEGLWGCSASLVAAACAAQLPGAWLAITPTLDDAEAFVEELKLAGAPDAVLFPPHESFPPDLPDFGVETTTFRCATARRLSLAGAERPMIVVAPVEALLQRLIDRRLLADSVLPLAVGQTFGIDALLAWLDRHRYEHTYTVEEPGQYARRGGIVDVFAHAAERPVRIDYFGDRIDAMRFFDVADQTSSDRCDTADIMGAAEIDTRRLGAEAFTESPIDFLPTEAVLVLRDPGDCETEARAALNRLDSLDGYDPWNVFARRVERLKQLRLWTFRSINTNEPVRFETSSPPPPARDLKKIAAQIESLAASYSELIVLCSSEPQAQRFEDTCRAELSRKAAGRIRIQTGEVGRGVCFDDVGAVVVNHRELFGHQRIRHGTRTFEAARPLRSLGELGEGDIVVHADHGIARYLGMETLQRDGRTGEFLTLEFDGGAKLYVPVSRIELVQKYLGCSQDLPSLSKLGTGTWRRRKEKAFAAASEMAGSLLRLQGLREAAPGIAFPPDTDWQRQFEADFPYDETPDQLDAIRAIKKDMIRSRPMDRLICGDVGYGKTELAIRAAFKAATAGMQVAVLVPTTVLAYQHYRTFSERMANYPVRVEMLSRFRTKAQQQQTLAGVAEGAVDIVIGTHRLLSGDIGFANLGLVVVDEEQRFGVKAKEHLKALRSTVDVLTLTATPIPRTLNMSLLGLRDIATLETPPLDRLAVRSQVTHNDEALIKQAILRELRRGGQVFFIHNRVADLGRQAARIEALCPEARVGMAHGQMREHGLEKIMLRFVEGEIDVLVCTTIVESGLDIRNANTLFVNNAHMYGLSDLHQLRGRVGRYNRRAYAYFMIPGDKILPEIAMKRLKAIEDFHELGAGFQIAMRDLEIRGAGNIVGLEQSGHIDAVGYDMYCRLLREAVERLKGEEPAELPDVHVDLAMRALIPDDYIARAREKVDIYRRLGQARKAAEVAALRDELTDRFGLPPPPVELLLRKAVIRQRAARLGITDMQQVGGRICVHFLDARRLEPALKAAGRMIRVMDAGTLYIILPEGLDDPFALVEFLEKLLHTAPLGD